MESVFFELETSTENGFWEKPTKEAKSEIRKASIMESYLYLPVASNEFEKAKFILTASKLYLINSTGRPKKYSEVSFKLAEPFIEVKENHERFGFRLYGKGIHQDFYTKNAVVLDEWIEALAKVCILQDIENDYEFQKQIGCGYTSTVYLAKSFYDSSSVAIKAFSKHNTLQKLKKVKLLSQEILTLRQLNHSRIVKLHRVYENKEFVYLVTEFISSEDCFSRIQKAPFTEPQAACFIKSFLSTLSWLHSKGIIHRDIKPENIMMKPNSLDFTLIDFGFSSSNITEDWFIRCGSAGYIAPEILRSQLYDSQVDIFSAGVVLYKLLSGENPFYHKSPKEMLRLNSRCKINFPRENWKGISKLAIDLIKQLTDTDPQTRLTASQALKHPWLKKY